MQEGEAFDRTLTLPSGWTAARSLQQNRPKIIKSRKTAQTLFSPPGRPAREEELPDTNRSAQEYRCIHSQRDRERRSVAPSGEVQQHETVDPTPRSQAPCVGPRPSCCREHRRFSYKLVLLSYARWRRCRSPRGSAGRTWVVLWQSGLESGRHHPSTVAAVAELKACSSSALSR